MKKALPLVLLVGAALLFGGALFLRLLLWRCGWLLHLQLPFYLPPEGIQS